VEVRSARHGRNESRSVRGVGSVLVVCLLSIGLAASASGAAGGGGRIVWTHNAADSPRAQIVSARPDGRHLRKLTHPKKHNFDIDAQISPDGATVAFERDHGDKSVLGLVDADGQNERSLDFGCTDPCGADLAPTWLNTGDRIVFTRVVLPFDQVNHSAHSAVLHTGLPDGSDVQRLSEPGIDGTYEDYHAHFSPDGSYIVFVRIRNSDLGVAVFRMSADGSGVRRLTPWRLDADLPDLSLATSGPTKDLIVFETYGMGAPEGKNQNIATVPSTCASVSDCRNQIKYVTDYGAGRAAGFNPTWSPNGRRIAYTLFKSDDDDHPCCVGDIWTIRPNGSHRKPVSQSPSFEFRPDWGPAPSG
jgi:Tol biopolymer transport system component